MEHCCTAGQPLSFEYSPKGTMERVGDLDIYIVGSADSGRAIIGFYDIFGLEYPQVKQFADRMAEGGFLVALPDVFRGKPWSKAKFPPKPEDNFMGWLQEHGGWEVMKPDAYKVVEHLKSKGATQFGSLGFCWGADIAIRLAADGSTFSAAGFTHPSWFGKEKELGAEVKCPVACCSAQGDPLETLEELLQGKPWATKCVYRRFGDQTHGFCAARGDYSKPEVAAAAGEAAKLLTEFFLTNLG